MVNIPDRVWFRLAARAERAEVPMPVLVADAIARELSPKPPRRPRRSVVEAEYARLVQAGVSKGAARVLAVNVTRQRRGGWGTRRKDAGWDRRSA